MKWRFILAEPITGANYEQGLWSRRNWEALLEDQLVAAIPESDWKLLQDTTHGQRSWPEDKNHENGNYYVECCICLRNFTGHKRRNVCRVCAGETIVVSASPPTPPSKEEQDMVKLILGEDIKPSNDLGSESESESPTSSTDAIGDESATSSPLKEPVTIDKAVLAEKLRDIAFEKEQRKEKYRLDKEELESLKLKWGLNFTYIRASNYEGEIIQNGGATIAWQAPVRKGDTMIWVAIAWCRNDETFNRTIGRLYAARQFNAGDKMRLRLKQSAFFSSQLKEVFTCLS